MSRRGRHQQICQSVYLVGGNALSDGADCLVYVVDLGELVLIDCGAGPGWTRIWENIASTGRDPSSLHTLVLTHAHIDHIGAAARVKKETGCRVVAHQLDAPAIQSADRGFTVADLYQVELEPTEVDHAVSGERETLKFSRGELKLIHTPGHTPGSMAALCDTPAERVLFGQDIHGPFSPAFGSDIEAWRESMQALVGLKADVLCEGHFGVFRPAAAVREFIENQLASKKTMMPVPEPR